MDEAFADDVRSIRWFSAVGQQPLPPFEWLTTAAASKAHAMAKLSEAAWENATLDASNRLRTFLNRNHWDRFAQWNPITVELKAKLVTPLSTSIWRPFADERGLPDAFAASVSWDVLGAAMEHEYRDCTERPVFFRHLLEVYRAGHVPCGWSGAWPTGRLVNW